MWNDKKIIDSNFHGTQMEKDMKNMYINWCSDAEKYVPLVNSIDNESHNNPSTLISKSEWLWARATLQARGFSFRKNVRLLNLDENGNASNMINNDIIRDVTDDNGDEEIHEIVDIVSFIPFITLSNHDDGLGGRTTMGNGDTFPHTSYTFQTKKKIEKDKQIFNFYGELSFQQKFLSFGWVDRFPISSPEGFCITALDIPLPALAASSISSDIDGNIVRIPTAMNKKNVLQLEIKSNILLASKIASRKLMEKKGKVNSDKESGRDSQQQISNELSLKITLLKFEIRNIIQKIEEKGLNKIEIIALMHDLLTDKKKNLIDGRDTKFISSDTNSNTSSKMQVYNNYGILSSTDEAKNLQQNRNESPAKMIKNTKLQQKTKAKTKTDLKKVQILADESEMESDGQYVRRIELEAIELLLTYLPSC